MNATARLFRGWRKRTPTPPEDVRLVYADGTLSIPLEVVYEGVHDEGLHVWITAFALGSQHADAILDGKARVQIGVLPPHTCVTIALDY